MTKITSKYAPEFLRDAELVKALETVRKAGLATAQAKDALIRRTVAFAYEQKNSDLVNGAAKWLESEGFRDVSAAYIFTLETILSGLVPCASFEGRVIYAPAWKDHDAICRKLKAAKPYQEWKAAKDAEKAAKPYQEWKAAKDAEKAAKKESRPAELVRSYSPENHADTTADRIDGAIAKLIKASDKDHGALNAAVIDGKDVAMSYLSNEKTDLVALRELCAFLSSHKITFRDALTKLQSLNA